MNKIALLIGAWVVTVVGYIGSELTGGSVGWEWVAGVAFSFCGAFGLLLYNDVLKQLRESKEERRREIDDLKQQIRDLKAKLNA